MKSAGMRDVRTGEKKTGKKNNEKETKNGCHSSTEKE